MEPQPHIVAVPRWTLGLHIAQLFLAVIILGLDAYGISFIAYNVLIYSLVVVSHQIYPFLVQTHFLTMHI